MTHVVTESCIKCKYTDCVDVCPVDCFRKGTNFLVIDPDECIGEAVRGRTIEILQKAGMDGKLFGSVTSVDIASQLSSGEISLNKSQIQLPDGPIKTIGEHTIRVVPHSEVVVEVTVKVLPELAEQ